MRRRAPERKQGMGTHQSRMVAEPKRGRSKSLIANVMAISVADYCEASVSPEVRRYRVGRVSCQRRYRDFESKDDVGKPTKSPPVSLPPLQYHESIYYLS